MVDEQYGRLEAENLRALNQHPEARHYTVPLVLAQLLQQGDNTACASSSPTAPLWLIVTEYMPHTGLSEDMIEEGKPWASAADIVTTFLRRCKELLQVRNAVDSLCCVA